MSRGEGGGRPRFFIDFDIVERLAKIQCTVEEIASVLGCSTRTLERSAKFSRIHKKGKDEGRASLRRLQWKGANEGNVTMQIWLGKQYLGQREKADIDTTIYNPQPLSAFYDEEDDDE